MIYILFDYPNRGNGPSFIRQGLGLDKAKEIYSDLTGNGKNLRHWLRGCLKVVQKMTPWSVGSTFRLYYVFS